MAEITLDRLAVYIEANTKQFENQLKRLEGQVNQSSTRMASSFNKMNASIVSAGRSFATAFGVGLGAGLLYQLPNMLIRSVNAMGQLQDASDKTGVSVEKLQKLIFAGLGSNTGMEQIVSSMAMFNERVGEGATKGGELQKLFEANGLSLRDQGGTIRDNLDLFKQVADLVKNARTEQEQTVIATMAFGRAGAEMLPILQQGGAAIERSMTAAVTHSGELVAAVDTLGDKWTERLKNMQTAMESFAASTALAMDAVIESMMGPLKTLDDYLKKSGGPGLGESIWNSLKTNPVLLPFTGLSAGRQAFGGGGSAPQTPTMEMLDHEKALREKLIELERLQSEFGRLRGGGADPAQINAARFRIETLQREIDLLRARNEWLGKSTGRAPGGPVLSGWGSDGRLNGVGPIAPTTVIPVVPEKIKETATAANDLSAALFGVSRAVDQVDAGMAKLVERQRAVAEASQGISDDLQQFTHSLLDGTGKISDQLKSLLATLNRQMLDAFMFGNGPFAKFFGQAGANGAPGGAIGNLIGRFFGGGATGANPLATAAGAAKSAVGGGIQSMFGGGPGAGLSSPAIPGGAVPSNVPYASTIKDAAARYGLDPSLLAGLIKQESAFNPNAVSHAGARGLTQLMPGTAKDLGVQNVFDPQENIYGGAKYLSMQLQRQGGNVPQALAAYNWGPGNLQKFGMGNMPIETQNYIKNVTGFQSFFATLFGGFADGGLVHGPGGARTDSIMARLSKGEFVVNASAAQKNLPALNAINSGRGSGTVVNIKNYSGQAIAQTTRRGADGRDNLELVIGQMEGRLMAGTRKMLGAEYGLAPQLARRS